VPDNDPPDNDPPDNDPPDEPDLAAGDFSSWIIDVQAAIRGEHGSDVPCDGCTACCTASQFVHIAPDEKDTLAHVPRALLFPAPRLPRGHVVMGYDERGHCPMLIDNQCSIYEHRPRTCRTYDCRVFAAAGIELDDDEKALINARARRWRFSYRTADDRAQHDAVRAASKFLATHADDLPAGAVPADATARAVLAVEIHDVFLRPDEGTGATPDIPTVAAELTRRGRLSFRGPTRASHR
jgi:Fe-S-cluster containining protein